MIRRQLLDFLLDNGDQFTSGEALSKQLGISRQAIWKHINALTESGYHIESQRKKGYRIVSAQELSCNGLAQLVNESTVLARGRYLMTVGSTNAAIKALAQEWTTGIVVADEQTAGRGRLGRAWRSERGAGLWFSVLLRPQIAPHLASMLTQLAALAMQRAIVACTGVSPQIKWPNDLHLDHRKLCGILTEMVSEMSAVEYVVIGIGVNVADGAVPSELADQAMALQSAAGNQVNRLQLLSQFLTAFEPLYRQFIETGDLSFVCDDLNALSNLVGRPIWVIRSDDRQPAQAIAINEHGELVVDLGGRQQTLHYGEVSIRPQ